jgi:hypothetical protein
MDLQQTTAPIFFIIAYFGVPILRELQINPSTYLRQLTATLTSSKK